MFSVINNYGVLYCMTNINKHLVHRMCTRQIIVADPVGPEADEFLLKVQKATTGWPWYMESPKLVWLGQIDNNCALLDSLYVHDPAFTGNSALYIYLL